MNGRAADFGFGGERQTFCVARLERKVAVSPSATSKKKEKNSFSTFADIEETAAKPYNRVEKLADVFSAPRRSRTVNLEKSVFPANLPESPSLGDAREIGISASLGKLAVGPQLPANWNVPQPWGTRRGRAFVGGAAFGGAEVPQLRDGAFCRAVNSEKSFFRKPFGKRRRRVFRRRNVGGRRRETSRFGFSGRERGVRSTRSRSIKDF